MIGKLLQNLAKSAVEFMKCLCTISQNLLRNIGGLISIQSTPFIMLKLGSIDVSALLKKRLIKVMFYNENN